MEVYLNHKIYHYVLILNQYKNNYQKNKHQRNLKHQINQQHLMLVKFNKNYKVNKIVLWK